MPLVDVAAGAGARVDITLDAMDDMTLEPVGDVAEEHLGLITVVVPTLVAREPALLVSDADAVAMETAVVAMLAGEFGEIMAGEGDSRHIFLICPTSMRWSNVSALRLRYACFCSASCIRRRKTASKNCFLMTVFKNQKTINRFQIQSSTVLS